jgi:transcriptional regulator with XRE-family HTH domain
MNMQSNQFTDNLREWRKHRKMSQLDLALAAEVSQRHVSWLETGRSQPSREMVVKLSDAMDVPLRKRNSILNSAGYANLYADKDLSEPSMQRVTHILEELLSHHNPYPAFVLDRQWNIKMKNEAADILFEILGDPCQVWRDVGDTGEMNIALLTVHPKGLRRFISNWQEVATPFMRRLKREALESGDESMLSRYDRLKNHAGELIDNDDHSDLVPVLPLEIDLGGPLLKLCSVISTFGTAQDITANELRIETFYPADETTRKYFKD